MTKNITEVTSKTLKISFIGSIFWDSIPCFGCIYHLSHRKEVLQLLNWQVKL